MPIWPVASGGAAGMAAPRARNCCVSDLDAEAAQLIADRVEGNLLAAKQELEKLSLLADGGPIGADLVLRSVGDSARYDVFQLARGRRRGRCRARPACVARPQERGRGTHPDTVGAATGSCAGCGRLASAAGCTPPIGAAAGTSRRRHRRARCRGCKSCRCRTCCCRPGLADRIIKGIAPGDAWDAITGLTGALAGALQATSDSGRVSR